MNNRIFIILLFFISCKVNQLPDRKEAIIVMEKSPCMGACPVYKISLFNDGFVTIDAKQFLDIKGQYQGILSEEELKEILDLYEASNIFEFDNSYKSNRKDLPTTYLTYRMDGIEKKIVDYDGAPEQLKVLERRMNDLVKSVDWKEVKQ